MATLTLDRFWVNLMSDGTAVAGYSDPDRTGQVSVPGEVRTYAGGRRRAVSQEGEEVTYSVLLVDLTKSQVETLQSWKGRHVQMRDNRGQRLVGTYFGVTRTEQRDGNYRAAFTFNGTTEGD